MKSIYPISTTSHSTIWQASWEFAAVGVEYLFMGDRQLHGGQTTEGNDDFRYIGLDAPNSKPQIEIRSGGYRCRNAVPQ
ncbi:hypothetical protein [Sphaerospermopsis aphanizomenoides]|uniref:hypothetical protein n=1 Tax=Sphaerospermopsis aphanizomenoides TaxID=459663 RepID=UPI000ABA6BA8|nr:hypothetical protein [Sphaerospermopsis aphanizomenoides]